LIEQEIRRGAEDVESSARLSADVAGLPAAWGMSGTPEAYSVGIAKFFQFVRYESRRSGKRRDDGFKSCFDTRRSGQ
jgi:hypothetical protein